MCVHVYFEMRLTLMAWCCWGVSVRRMAAVSVTPGSFVMPAPIPIPVSVLLGLHRSRFPVSNFVVSILFLGFRVSGLFRVGTRRIAAVSVTPGSFVMPAPIPVSSFELCGFDSVSRLSGVRICDSGFA